MNISNKATVKETEEIEEEILREEYIDIEMPERVTIGCPGYIYERPKSDLVFMKNFSNTKDWLGRILVTESSFDINDEEHTFVDAVISFAPTEELLNAYLYGFALKVHEEKESEIGVDTARYQIDVDNRSVNINTLTDGYVGFVSEYYNEGELDGIAIELSGFNANDFDEYVETLRYVFAGEII